MIQLATVCPIGSSLLQGPERGKEDLISQLPDDVLISIVSRMPTKDAVRTSLLSRRWKNLYRFLPVSIELGCMYLIKHMLVNNPGSIRTRFSLQRWRSLDKLLYNIELGVGSLLAHEDPHNPVCTISSVDSFLRLHSSYNNKIHSFRLSCCLDKSITRYFRRCICFLGRLGVEKLFLECCCSDRKTSDLSFSCHLFSQMPSLKYFELSRCSLRACLRIGHLSNYSLQTIVLRDVTVSPGAVECILSNCSRLHSLTITSCKCPPKLRFCGPRLELKSLCINACEGVDEIEFFYAINLVVFEFWSNKMVNLIFDHVPQLQSVYLNMYSRNIVPYVCGRLALDLPHLKSLNFVTTGMSVGGNIQDMEINMFNKLRRLSIDMRHLPKIDLRLLTSILQQCPLVQQFHLNVNSWGSDGQQVEKQAVVFHSELKKVEIGGFDGTEHEMEFALYTLKSAINLEKMHISKCFRQYEVFPGGSGRWCVVNATPWSLKMQGMIHSKLQGQAVSKIAQVIIQHKPPTHFQD